MKARLHILEMPTAALVVGALACLATLAGCSQPPRPAPAPPKIQSVPVPITSADDREFVAQVLSEQGGTREITTLPDVATARTVSSGLLVPRDTLGRKLIAVTYAEETDPQNGPWRSMGLVYEGRLLVRQTLYCVRKPVEYFTMFNQSQEATRVGGAEADVFSVQQSHKGLEESRMEWNVGLRYYDVWGWRMSKADVVRVARSMGGDGR